MNWLGMICGLYNEKLIVYYETHCHMSGLRHTSNKCVCGMTVAQVKPYIILAAVRQNLTNQHIHNYRDIIQKNEIGETTWNIQNCTCEL